MLEGWSCNGSIFTARDDAYNLGDKRPRAEERAQFIQAKRKELAFFLEKDVWEFAPMAEEGRAYRTGRATRGKGK
eukprot:10248804-Prorocentrum_lima.AAC.1